MEPAGTAARRMVSRRDTRIMLTSCILRVAWLHCTVRRRDAQVKGPNTALCQQLIHPKQAGMKSAFWRAHPDAEEVAYGEASGHLTGRGLPARPQAAKLAEP